MNLLALSVKLFEDFQNSGKMPWELVKEIATKNSRKKILKNCEGISRERGGRIFGWSQKKNQQRKSWRNFKRKFKNRKGFLLQFSAGSPAKIPNKSIGRIPNGILRRMPNESSKVYGRGPNRTLVETSRTLPSRTPRVNSLRNCKERFPRMLLEAIPDKLTEDSPNEVLEDFSKVLAKEFSEELLELFSEKPLKEYPKELLKQLTKEV